MGVNEQINFKIYITNLDKYEVKVLTIRILFVAKF